MEFIKCERCNTYSEPTEHKLRHSYGGNHLDLCWNCIDELERFELEYDAFECGYPSVEAYLARDRY